MLVQDLKMYINTSVKSGFDYLLGILFKWSFARYIKSVAVITVLHVEDLDNDQHFENVVEYAEHYYKVTGNRTLAAVMTPLSPILMRRLEVSGFSPSVYQKRIGALSSVSEIGLHGHFVNRLDEISMWPMHEAFFDLKKIKKQLFLETEWLEANSFFSGDCRFYSGGWWFSNRELRYLLRNLGYSFDFTLSSNKFNSTPFSTRFKNALRMGKLVVSEDGLTSCNALCSIAKNNRPLATLNKLVAASISSNSPVFSLYSHDYDLDLCEAKKSLSALVAYGVKFIDSAGLAGLGARACCKELFL